LTRIPAPFIAILIWCLSSQSTVPLPKGIFGVDKIAHFIAYGALSLALSLWFSRKQWRAQPWGIAVAVVAIASLYGAVDEFHQSFVPGRDMSAWDWLADVIGAGIGTGILVIAFAATRSAKRR
jgi:VanZ family protein